MPEGRDSIVQIQSMLDQLSSYDASNRSISKVPDFLRGVNEEAYDPTIVAIGPVHHNKIHVQGMQQHKVWYLQQLLEKTTQDYVGQQYNLVRYLDKIRDSEESARKYYSSSIQLPDKERFMEMLLLDGVFVIELARKWSSKKLINDDYIFQYSEVHYNDVLIQIRRDLLMIENQLPFFILQTLFDLTKKIGGGSDNDVSLHRLLLCFFRRIIPGELDPIGNDFKVDDHLFGLVYEAHFKDETIVGDQENFMFDEINSISELREAGIKFRKAEKTTTLMNVKFTKGVMEIPKLEVGDVTESLFRNLIAYELIRYYEKRTPENDNTDLDRHKPRYVTEYCFLMQFLVNSKKDVEILRRAGIVTNWMGDDEMVRLFFNKLTKNVASSQEFYYANIIRSMNDHCRRHRWRANFRKKYLNSPWKIMSLMAAALLLLMTLAQTVFAILSYRQGFPKHN